MLSEINNNNLPSSYILVVVVVVIISIHDSKTNAHSNYDELFPYATPDICNNGEYFDVGSFSCAVCDPDKNLQPSNNRLNCVCDERSRLVDYRNGNPVCELCGTDEIPTIDGLDCIRCSVGENNESCECSPSEIRLERYLNGTLFENLKCISCPENFHPSSDGTRCLNCRKNLFESSNNCLCPMVSHLRINGYCVLKNGLMDWPDIRNTYLVRYENQQIDSYYLRTELQLAVYLCKNGNKTACQHLANICVLTLFNNLMPCKVFLDKHSSPVWLYYGDGEAPAVLNRRKISQQYSLDSRNNNSKVNIALAKFSLNGEFLSVSSANLICDLLTNVKFGVNIEKSCEITAKKLNDMRVEIFEPYLEFVEGEKTLFYAIPVLIRNSNKELIDASRWQLVRKFFIVDSITGVKALPNSFNTDFRREKQPSVIRYAKSVQVLIKVQNKEEKGRIYPPLIIIEYGELSSEELRRNVVVKIGYKISYVLEDNDMSSAIEVSIGVLSGLGVAFSATKAWSNYKRNGSETPNGSAVFWFLIFCSGTLGNVLIFVSFCASVHTLVFYKGQAVLHVLLPSEKTDDNFRIFVIVAFSLKLVEILALIYRLRKVEIFLVDWEQPRTVQSQPKYDSPRTSLKKLYANRFPREKSSPIKTPSEIISARRNKTPMKSAEPVVTPGRSRSRYSTPSKSDSNPPEQSTGDFNGTGDAAERLNGKQKPPVSIWRTYFVANEWFKLQTMRKANMLVQGMVTLLILEVIGLKFWARAEPEFAIEDAEPELQERNSFVLKFSVGTLVYGFVYCSQCLVAIAFYERYVKNRIQEFVDLCSVANISVFILAEKQFGFYIHGRSVHGFADTDLPTLINDLKEEEDNLCAHRGLLPGTTDQSFVISVSTRFRNYYDKIMSPVKSEETRFLRKNSTLTSKLEKNVKTYKKMRKFLTHFVDHCFKDLDYTVREKQFIEKLFDIEFTDGVDRSIFYIDNNHSFDGVMFYGNEWILVTFEVTLFNFVVTVSENYILAIIITVLVSQLLVICRIYNGKKNLAEKTLIDERFIL